MLTDILTCVSKYTKLLIDADTYVRKDGLKTTKIILSDTGACVSIILNLLVDADTDVSFGLSTKIC